MTRRTLHAPESNQERVMYGAKTNAQWHFEALKRILDRKEPDYKT